MSVLFVLGAVLILGFTAVGLVNFLAWRRGMREGLPTAGRRQAA